MLAALLQQATPDSDQALLTRAQMIAGFTFAELAQAAQLIMPIDLRRDKGWVGMLIERYLGATAGSRPEPDFAHLGIELKTIPVDPQGKPLETTFVCVAPLMNNQGIAWQNSLVKQKLSKVLWVPIEGSRQLPLAERRVGNPLLWQANPQQERALEQDWQELMDMIVLGRVEQISAKQGQYLQLRPKAAHSRILTEAIGAHGQPIMTLPRGFYLKKNFTAPLLAEHFALTKLTPS